MRWFVSVSSMCVCAVVTVRGWVVGAGDWVSPKAVAASTNQETNVQQLSQLTNYLIHLEAK